MVQSKFQFDNHSQRIAEARQVVRDELRRKDVDLCDQLKDKGITKVLDNAKEEFKERVLEEIVYLASKRNVFTGEDIREACKHLGEPTHCNFWGAIMNAAGKGKLIKKTGKYVKSKLPRSHSHMIAEWEKY